MLLRLLLASSALSEQLQKAHTGASNTHQVHHPTPTPPRPSTTEQRPPSDQASSLPSAAPESAFPLPASSPPAMPPVTFWQRWVKPDVYPLIGAMGAGLTFMVYTGVRTIVAPDVFVNKETRSTDAAEMCNDRMGMQYKHSPLRELVKKVYDVESTVSPHAPARR